MSPCPSASSPLLVLPQVRQQFCTCPIHPHSILREQLHRGPYPHNIVPLALPVPPQVQRVELEAEESEVAAAEHNALRGQGVGQEQKTLRTRDPGMSGSVAFILTLSPLIT